MTREEVDDDRPTMLGTKEEEIKAKDTIGRYWYSEVRCGARQRIIRRRMSETGASVSEPRHNETENDGRELASNEAGEWDTLSCRAKLFIDK